MNHPDHQGPQDVTHLLSSAADALSAGATDAAMMSFHRALAASPDPFTQYHVVKALSDAGCHRQALDIIEPYYNPTSASPELVAAMLTAAVAANDTHVTRWLLDHVTHASDQSVATAAYAARDFLAPQRSLTAQTPIQRPPLANPNPAHTPTPVVPGHPPVLQNPPDWLSDKPKHTISPGTRKLAVAGVAAVLLAGVTSAHFLMRTTTHKSSLPATASQDYCGNLHTVLITTPTNAAPTTAQRTQITAAARAMEVTAPQPLIATTQSWATTLTAELSAQVAHTAPTLSYTAFVANQNKIVTWARLNCPAGTLPKNIVIIPITTTTTLPPTPQVTMPQVTPTPTPATPTPSPTTTTPRSTTPAQTSPTPTPTPAPTPTTTPPSTSGVSGGTQSLSVPGSTTFNATLTQFVPNAPPGSNVQGQNLPIAAGYFTITNTGSSSLDLSLVNWYITSGGSTSGGPPDTATTTLGGPLPMSSLPPGATASGWLVMTSEHVTGAATISLSIGPSQSGYWHYG